MEPSDLVALFDQQAAGYDRQWAKTAPIRDCLYFLLEPLLAPLPAEARVLCVGVGTGQEMAHLAAAHPGWSFTAVEPSGAMLEACRQRADAEGFATRCRFHHGFLETLPADAPYDAATCFLVSQFILDPAERTAFFAAIGRRLRKGGVLAWADLAWDTNAPDYPDMLRLWMRTMSGAGLDDEAIERMRGNYARDVAILPPDRVAALVADAGFEAPLRFHQAGMIHGWYARRRKSP